MFGGKCLCTLRIAIMVWAFYYLFIPDSVCEYGFSATFRDM